MRHDYFDTWSSDMAYILGFIMADGSIRHKDYCKCNGYSLVINLKLDDISILEYIKSQIETKANVLVRKWTGSDDIYREQCSITITSKHLIERLMQLGVIPQKTGKESFPSMPKEFESDFMRGYFDGDGCIQNSYQIQNGKRYGKYLFKISCANEQFLNTYKDRLGISHVKTRLHGSNCYALQIQGKKDILKIRNMFYSKPYSYTLERKKNTFDSIG